MSDALIVVADDDRDILRLIERRLSRRGYEVVTARDGAAAVEAVRQRSPDAVVLDWMMPSMSGTQACRILKGDPASAGIPVVLLTAKAATVDLEEGLATGADAYLTKPFELSELDALLRRLIGE